MTDRTLALAAFALLATVPAFAQSTVELNLSLETTRLEAFERLTATVSGVASCPQILDTVVHEGRVEIFYSGSCAILPPAPTDFSLSTRFQVARAGIWEVRVIDVDFPADPGLIVASAEVKVIDPRYALDVTPSPANADDEVMASFNGFAVCLFQEFATVGLAPGRIEIRLEDFSGLCDPPEFPKPFNVSVEVGRLDAGAYTVDAFHNGRFVMDATLFVGEGFTNNLRFDVEPSPPVVGEPIAVVIRGEASCPQLVEQNVGEGFVEIVYRGSCSGLPPDPIAFTLRTLIDPLPLGVWEIRLIDLDVPTTPPAVVLTKQVMVVDPDFSVELVPSPANEGDEIIATIAGVASCLLEDRSRFEEADELITIHLQEISGICDPPEPPEAFEISLEIGQLLRGHYLVEVFLNERRVTGTTLLVGGGSTRNLRLDVEPSRALTTEPVVVAVRGEAPCPQLVEQIVGDGVVEIFYRGFCSSEAPEEFSLFTLVGPLSPGIWEFQLIDLDIPVSPPAVFQTLDVTVTDPDFSLELMPSPATIDDEVVAALTGVGDCVTMSPIVEIEPGSLVFRVEESGVCNPPTNEPFGFITEVGRLEAGQYLAELFFSDQRVAESTLEVTAEPRTCVSDLNGLCLNQERFRVEAVWTTRAGDSGFATPVPETDDTGLFWFFDEDNVELVVKVLDGCNTAIPNFWVFAAGLTDVGVRLTVSDTQTGRFVVYETTPGQTFEPITDTAAFDICPGS